MKLTTKIFIIACIVINTTAFSMLKKLYHCRHTKKDVVLKRNLHSYGYPNEEAFELFNQVLTLERENTRLKNENKELYVIINSYNKTALTPQKNILNKEQDFSIQQ